MKWSIENGGKKTVGLIHQVIKKVGAKVVFLYLLIDINEPKYHLKILNIA